MSKVNYKELAEKIVDKYATYEDNEVDILDKPLNPDELSPMEFEKKKQIMIRFVEFGYSYGNSGDTKKDAREEIVEILSTDLENGNLVLSDEILGSL